MANPMKVLTALSASQGLVVSGSDAGLKVMQGEISGSSNLKVGGNATVSGWLSASQGAVINGTSGLVVNQTGTFGAVIIEGDLRVKGTTTTVDSTTVNIADALLSLGTGSATTADLSTAGAGIELGNGGLVTFKYTEVGGVNGWQSNKNLSLTTGNSFKIGDAAVLSATTLGSSVLVSSLTGVGVLKNLDVNGSTVLSGAIQISSSQAYGVQGQGNWLNTGLNSLTGALANLSSSIIGAILPSLNVGNQINTGYQKLRKVGKKALTDGMAIFEFSGSQFIEGAPNSTAFQGIGDLDRYTVDVAVFDNGVWTNDLVSIAMVTGSAIDTNNNNITGSVVVTASAPGAGGSAQIRVTVIYEGGSIYNSN